MDICQIEGATRILNAPTNWESDIPCQSLPIADQGGWMVSEWKPDAADLERLNADGSIFLYIHGTIHPVVGLGVDGGSTQPDGPVGVVQELANRNAEVKLLRLTIKRLQDTLANQGRMCAIALAATGEQDGASDL